MVLNMQHDAWINRATARAHHQAFQRRKSHGGIDAATAHYRRGGATVAQMADHDSQCFQWASKHLRGAASTVGMAQSMETITANPPIAGPAIGHRVGEDLGRECSMECR